MSKKNRNGRGTVVSQDTAKPNTDEIATIKNDFVMDYVGSVATNPDKILRSESGGKGIELYEDLLRDPEVASALQKRTLSVIGREREVVAASEDAKDVEVADFVREVLENFKFDDACKALMTGLILGYKPAEVMWAYTDDGFVVISKIVGKASRRFVFDLQGKLRLLTMHDMVDGVEVPERKFIVFENTSANGSYYGDGLGRSVFWPVWFRKNGIKFWAIFCDKYGSPTPVGKYPPGTHEQKQKELLDAIAAIQQETGIVIPDTMLIELMEAQRSGSIDTYKSFCEYMDKIIDKVILGHSAATESTPGKLGNEKQAEQTRLDYLKADADALCICLNESVIKWLVDYNFPGVKKYPKVWFRVEPEKDLKALADRDKVLTNDIGLDVTKKYFYETYAIPEPKEGEELVTPASQGAPGAQQGCPNCGGGAGAPPASTAQTCPDCGSNDAAKQSDGQKKCQECGCSFAEQPLARQDVCDALTANLLSKANLDPMVNRIKDLAEKAGSLEELKSSLLEAYNGMNPVDLGNLMQRGFAAAELAGMAGKQARM